ncbi:hypothetical protein EHP00_1259 [Ecytonucleospora hepatopenaei]|uniref:Uncharacterized protein n=1 Tax=Ecytonucleospora hepatopenaei TaxID=646526 RepID=A0A1W0E3D9_9MICR|nr:hypothetical protein EHP00_1259 [Ecytonucleospora hepatopenaei]
MLFIKNYENKTIVKNPLFDILNQKNTERHMTVNEYNYIEDIKKLSNFSELTTTNFIQNKNNNISNDDVLNQNSFELMKAPSFYFFVFSLFILLSICLTIIFNFIRIKNNSKKDVIIQKYDIKHDVCVDLNV